MENFKADKFNKKQEKQKINIKITKSFLNLPDCQ